MSALINKGNSIESSSFSLVFERNFDLSELQSLARLENSLAQELPVFKELSEISFNIDMNAVTESHKDISGVLLQSFAEDGKVTWRLKVEKNIIGVSCLDYDHWDPVWGKTQKFLLEVVKSIESVNNKLVICALTVIDKFVARADSYKIEQVFNLKTPYLTQNVLNGNSGMLWHIYEGWFEHLDEKIYLNALNLSTAGEESEIISNIEHTIQGQFINSPQLIADFKTQEMAKVFSLLHDKNKLTLRNLLSQVELERIGLCKV